LTEARPASARTSRHAARRRSTGFTGMPNRCAVDVGHRRRRRYERADRSQRRLPSSSRRAGRSRPVRGRCEAGLVHGEMLRSVGLREGVWPPAPACRKGVKRQADQDSFVRPWARGRNAAGPRHAVPPPPGAGFIPGPRVWASFGGQFTPVRIPGETLHDIDSEACPRAGSRSSTIRPSGWAVRTMPADRPEALVWHRGRRGYPKRCR
jgi:hypothetical protein